MFRAVYKSASAYTTVTAADGKKVKSIPFQVDRGVIQGDITSPLYFIMALELILRRYDSDSRRGVTLAESLVHTLGYADDAALTEFGDEEGIQRLTSRVTSIASGSRADADMEINVDKTKTLHVCEQDTVSKTTNEEAEEVCAFTCPHLHCGHKFLNAAGMRIHASRCKWKSEFKVQKILDIRGNTTTRQYLIRWDGYSADSDT